MLQRYLPNWVSQTIRPTGLPPLPEHQEDVVAPESNSTAKQKRDTQPKIDGNSAFNLAQGVKSFLQIPSYTLQGVRTHFNNWASGNFASDSVYDPDSPLNIPIPDQYADITIDDNRDALNLMGNQAGEINTVLKYIIYGISIWGHLIALKKAKTEPDEVNKRLLQIKNYGEIGYAAFMLGEKTLRPFIRSYVKQGNYARAATLQALGLFSSTMAWLTVAPASVALLAHERYKHKVNLLIDEAHATGQISKEEYVEYKKAYKENSGNIQNGVQKFSGALVRIPIQGLTLTTGAFLMAGVANPELFGQIMDSVPYLPEYFGAAQSNLDNIDISNLNHETPYYWISGSFYMPKAVSMGFAALAALGPTMGVYWTSQKTRSAVKERTALMNDEQAKEDPQHDQHIARATRKIYSSASAIVGSVNFTGAALVSTFPAYDQFSYYLGAAGFVCMSASYFIDHPEFLGLLRHYATFGYWSPYNSDK